MTTFVNLVLIVIDYAEARDADCGGQISFKKCGEAKWNLSLAKR